MTTKTMVLEQNLNEITKVYSYVQRAQQGAQRLNSISHGERSRGLQILAQGLEKARDRILEANTLDLETSREMAVSDLILDWLKLTPERLQRTSQFLQRLGEIPEPLGRMVQTSYSLERGQSYSQFVPLGSITFLYEAFPELGAIAAGFALKTGNAIILKGGSEASHTNGILAEVFEMALSQAKIPLESVQFVASEESSFVQDLVSQDGELNLVIPYGRPSFVQQIANWATVPVLRSAMGNCYLYCSPTGDFDQARWLIIDSHASEPDPVNAIEKVLVNQSQGSSSLTRLFNSLEEKGFELRGDRYLQEQFPDRLKLAKDEEWFTAYLRKIVAFKAVDNLEEAIAWINQYSSGHADCLVTESYPESIQFSRGVNSALVYINASPRFYRNPQRSEALFLGISNQKGQRRGLIRLDSLMTIKQVILGQGM